MGIISGPIGKGLSLFKLKQATANASDVLKGVTFFSKDKILKTGTMRNNGRWPTADKLTMESGKLWMYKADGYTEGGLGAAGSLLGNASASDLMQGKTASSANGLKFSGGIVNKGAVSATLNPGGSYTVPAGYHNGSGKITAASLKTVTVSITKNLWNYTVPGTLVGFSNLGEGAAVVGRIYISGNTAYYENKTGGTTNRTITLVYY